MASIYKVGTKWRAQIRLAGRPPKSEMFETQLAAKRWAREQEAKQHTDLHDGGQAFTVAKAITEYRTTLAKIGVTKASILELLAYHLGSRRLAEVTPKIIVQYAKDRLSGKALRPSQYGAKKRRGRRPVAEHVGPSSVLMEVVYLRSMLKHSAAILDSQDAQRAMQACDLAATTLRHGNLIRPSEKRTRRPTIGELHDLMNAFDQRRSNIPMTDIMLFAICTTMRLSEIMALRWEDWNAVDRTIWVRERKDPTTFGGRNDLVPLVTGPVRYRGQVICPVEIIMRQRTARARQGRIFPFAGGTVGKAWEQTCEKLQIQDLRFHDLRHDGISRLFEHGYQIPQVALISGHKSWESLKRYTQIDPVSLHSGLILNQ